MLEQDTALFQGTVLENIRKADPEATDEEVEEAVRLAAINFDTSIQVGVRGRVLSGGQRQRVGLARAILRDRPVLCLDEPVSAQDSERTNSIAGRLSRLCRRDGTPVTVISSSHTVSLFEGFNWAIVLANRRLAEAGHVDALMKRRGLFCQLINDQGGVTVDSSGRAKLDVDKLRAVWLFADAPLPALQKLAPLFTTRKHAVGEVIYSDGEVVDTVFLVVSGRVDLVKPESPDAPAVGATLRSLEAGSVLTELALLGDVVADHSAVVRTAATTLSLSRIHFDNVLEAIPALRDAVKEVADDRSAAISPGGLRAAWPLSRLPDNLLSSLAGAQA